MIIENDEEHKVMLELLDELMEKRPGSLAISIVAKVIEEYELIHFPLPEPTPEEAAAFRREQEQGHPMCSCPPGHCALSASGLTWVNGGALCRRLGDREVAKPAPLLTVGWAGSEETRKIAEEMAEKIRAAGIDADVKELPKVDE